MERRRPTRRLQASAARRSARRLREIHEELERAATRRTSLWHELSSKGDGAKAAEVAALNRRIDALWVETRELEAQLRWGPPELIVARARAEEKLERRLVRRARAGQHPAEHE